MAGTKSTGTRPDRVPSRRATAGPPPDAERRTPDWHRNLSQLKAALISAAPADNDRYRHGVLWIDGELPADVDRINPRILAGGGRVRRVIPVKSPAGGHLFHYFFDDGWGDDGGGLDLLARIVRRAATILENVPRRVLPPFALPPVVEGRDEGLVLWVSLLHRLGRAEDNAIFRSNLEALPSKDDLSTWAAFSDWDRFPVLPGFDPVHLMTAAAADSKTLGEWRAEHRASGRHLPEVIAASLSKPLWYASANAIDQILLLDRAAPPRATPRPRHRTGGASADHRADPNRELKRRIVIVLCDHHRPTDADQCDEPLSQEQIAARLGVDQSTVSRGLGALLQELPCCRGKKTKKAYRDLCDTTRIHNELVRLRIKYTEMDLSRLITRENMNRLATALADETDDADRPED